MSIEDDPLVTVEVRMICGDRERRYNITRRQSNVVGVFSIFFDKFMENRDDD